MDVKQEFYKMLQLLKKQLIVEYTVKQFHHFLLFASIYMFVITLISRWVVFIYSIPLMVLGIVIIFLSYSIQSLRSLPHVRHAAILYDHFVGENRTTTALSFLNEEDLIYNLQRKDALQNMKRHQSMLLSRKRTFFYPKPIILTSLFLNLSLAMLFFPNETMLLAKERKTEQQMIKEIKTDLQDKVDQELDPSVKKEMEALLDEENQLQKLEDLLSEIEKKHYELELKKKKTEKQRDLLNETVEQLKSIQMEDMAKALQDNDQTSIKEALAKIGSRELTHEEQQVLGKMLNDGEPFTKEQLEQLEEFLMQLAQEATEVKQIAEAQEFLQNTALDIDQLLAERGIQTDTDLSQLIAGSQQSNSNQQQAAPSQSENQGSSDSQGGHESGNEPGQQSGNEPSNQPGNGNGTGSTPGAGGQQQQGSGTGGSGDSPGNGSGLGAGRGMGSRELTIPETVDGQMNIEKDLGSLGQGDPAEQSEGDGPVLKGTVRPYEQVYNEYEQVSRESMERRQLPSELENIVKNYFTKIKPE